MVADPFCSGLNPSQKVLCSISNIRCLTCWLPRARCPLTPTCCSTSESTGSCFHFMSRVSCSLALIPSGRDNLPTYSRPVNQKYYLDKSLVQISQSGHSEVCNCYNTDHCYELKQYDIFYVKNCCCYILGAVHIPLHISSKKQPQNGGHTTDANTSALRFVVPLTGTLPHN